MFEFEFLFVFEKWYLLLFVFLLNEFLGKKLIFWFLLLLGWGFVLDGLLKESFFGVLLVWVKLEIW